MFQYDQNMQKKRVENYQAPKRVQFKNTVENYGSSNDKNKWLWVVLYVVVALLLVALVVYLVRSRKSGGPRLPTATTQFGFRFY